MNFTLEQYRIFPLIAWMVFIGFALFVGHLAFQLYTVTNDIAYENELTLEIANHNSARIDALEELLEER